MLAALPSMTTTRRRVRLDVTGAVQGVGFRPFVHRLATGMGLAGHVRNTGEGAALEVEGPAADVEGFLQRLEAEIAPPARILARRVTELALVGETQFVVDASTAGASNAADVMADLVTCADCLTDMFQPGNRRHLYPFTTCSQCGPRYSIIEAMPFDRARTSMRLFAMCPECRAEYDDPASRRFHAETISCPRCGPTLRLLGREIAGQAALHAAVEALRDGAIVALKGLGGFQLMVDARSHDAVARLRALKHRPAKPFAVMVASLSDARALADLSSEEADALSAPAGPIVLVRARRDAPIAGNVAPGNPSLGLMLPTTPLHHIVLRELGFPVIATSGNRGDEPIVSDENEVAERLVGLADLFLVHDRPIVRPVDDSVVQLVGGKECVLRLARGYAPLHLECSATLRPGIALGAEQKGAIAVARDRTIVLGPHIGDLSGPETRTAMRTAKDRLAALYGIDAGWIAADTHPDYFTGRLATWTGLPVHRVQHHVAHVLAGMLDNGLKGNVLGVAWDGTGYGEDGTIWGGEFIAVGETAIRRVAHLLPFRLPGGDAAAREPRRSAFGALHAVFGDAAAAHATALSSEEARVFATMIARAVNAPLTSSCGRLFDAVASILGLCQTASFEGEAAMAVEFAADHSKRRVDLPPIVLTGHAPIVLDWRGMLRAMIQLREDVPGNDLAAAFHRTLVDAVGNVAARIGIENVLLTGGCFQNVRLAEAALDRLEQDGFRAYSHHQIPPNDGGIAAGQLAFVARQRLEEAT